MVVAKAEDDRLASAFAAQNARAAAVVDTEAESVDQGAQFRKERVGRLVGDHVLVAMTLFALTWRFAPLSVAFSYAVGSIFGAAYLVLLARYVESVGKQSIEGARSAGVSQARFALVGVLVLIAGKNKEVLDFIPLFLGFFTYQLASFVQAFRPVEDDLS